MCDSLNFTMQEEILLTLHYVLSDRILTRTKVVFAKVTVLQSNYTQTLVRAQGVPEAH
jgi:hypothetical protein